MKNPDNTVIDVGGEISKVYFNEVDKLNIITDSFPNNVISIFKNIKISNNFNIDEDIQNNILVFTKIPEVTVGNIITSLKIINNGNNLYTSIPNIYALYRNNQDEFVIDNKFNLRDSNNKLDYLIINGNIKGRTNESVINVIDSSNNYSSIDNTKIVVGGEINSINFTNDATNIVENKGFTDKDKVLLGSKISNLSVKTLVMKWR